MLMCLGEMAPQRPWACLTPPVKPHKVRQDPPSRRRLKPFPLLVRTRRCRVCERLAETGCPGGIAPQAHRPHHPSRHQARRLCQRPRGGENLRVCPPAAPTCHLPLARVAGPHRWGRPWGGGECGSGEDDTTRLVDTGGSGQARGGQGAVELVDQPRGLSPVAGASPGAIARRRASPTGTPTGGRHVLCEGRPGLPRLGFTRPGGAASWRQGLDRCLTL